jgi:predicted transcriptional regulator
VPFQEITMSQSLTRDEYDALEQVTKTPKSAKPSACIARNAKHLVGIKFLTARKDGSYVLTEKGAEALFIKSCIAGLRALATDGDTKLDITVATFLGRKGHIVAGPQPGQYAVTAKGRECLADIALNP